MFDCLSSCHQGRNAGPHNTNSKPGLCLGQGAQSVSQVLLWIVLLLVTVAGTHPWANAQDPSVVGQFSPLMNWYTNATHAVLLPNGRVLWWPAFLSGVKARIWDPVSNTNTLITPPAYNIFCSSFSLLTNGQVFFTGGDAVVTLIGLPNTSTYDPVGGNWTPLPNMNAGRWYPTNTVLPNGDILVTAGDISPTLGGNGLPQVWQVSSGTWRDLSTAQLLMPLYPKMFLAPNGTIFNAGPSQLSRYLNTDGTGGWTIGPMSQFGIRDYGPAVMYDNGKIMMAGGGIPPTATAEVINLNDPVPTWRYTASMAYPRRQANATLLPDGTVLVTGGSSGPTFDDYTHPVFPAELWNPTTGTWTTMASLTTYRGYHSLALLLPDGRVLSAGGQCGLADGCNVDTAEVFSPPYFFKGTRPSIASAPASVKGGQTFFVGTPDAANITQVTWIRFGAVTHTFNQEQRISFLNFSQATGGLNVTAPPSANLAPPGFYMLFLLNSNGVPSVASIIQVDNSGFATNGPAVSLSRTSLSFTGPGKSWQVGGMTPSQSVQLTNLGTTPVTINSVTTGTDFTVTSNTCGAQLAPGTCTINVAFKPTTGGPLNEFLTINDSDPGSPQTVALRGVGAALKFTGSVNFGNALIGTTSTPMAATLTNTGTGAINITGISYSSSEFSQYLPSSTCGTSIPGLSSCQVFSTFSPNATGTQTASFSVSDSDPSSPSTVTLKGVGLALKFSRGSISFGKVNIPQTTNPVTITVTNLAPVTVNFSNIAIAGTNPGDFAIQSNTCGAALGQGTNCILGITFAPKAAGLRSATVSFTDDGGGSPQVVLLGGTGAAVLSSIAVTPAQSSVPPGNTQQFTATGNYSDGTNSNITTTATWASSNTAAATISNTSGSQGLATGVALGSTTITATLNSVKGSTSLAVQNSTTAAVESNNNPSTFGQAVQFTATVSPGTATGTVQFKDGSNVGRSE
jgi:hypothetical protein